MNLIVPALGGLAVATGLLPWFKERGRDVMNNAERKSAPGKFIRLSKGLTHYEWSDLARGPVAVLVHGLTTPSFVWGGLKPLLEGLGFRVLTYDLYGRGYSDRPRGRQTPEFFVAQLAELLETQGIEEDITLIGYSMGGTIVTAFADTYPEKLRRLILLAPAGMGHNLGAMTRFAAEVPLLGTWAFHMTYPEILKRGIDLERGIPSSVSDIGDLQLNELNYQGYLRSVLSSLRGSLRRTMEPEHRRLFRKPLPVLAIWGEEDTVIPLTGLGRLAEWNRDARQDTVKGAGHGLTYTHPQAITDIIAEAISVPPI